MRYVDYIRMSFYVKLNETDRCRENSKEEKKHSNTNAKQMATPPANYSGVQYTKRKTEGKLAMLFKVYRPKATQSIIFLAFPKIFPLEIENYLFWFDFWIGDYFELEKILVLNLNTGQYLSAEYLKHKSKQDAVRCMQT